LLQNTGNYTFFREEIHIVQCPKNECIISELLCLQNDESAIYLQREEQLRIEGGIQVSKICRIQGTEKSKMGSRADLGTAPQIKDMLKRGERATTKKNKK